MRNPVPLFCALWCGVLSAPATPYYVSSGANSVVTGVDALGGGRGRSPTLPFRTIQFAADQTLPGDTVFVRAGTYVNQYSFSPGVEITRSGTANAWIVYRNYPGDAQKPLLRFNTWQGFKLSGNIAYIEINGFRVQGNNGAINNPDGSPNPTAALNQPGSCALNGVGTPLAMYNGNGISTSGSTALGAQNPHHLRFVNNEVFDCGGVGIGAMQSDYVTIENNLIYNNSWYTKYATSGISLYQNWNYDTAPGYHMVVRNNRCFGNRLYVPWWRGGTFGCMGFTDGNGIILDDSRNSQNGSRLGAYTGRTLIANNLCVNNGGSGIHALLSDHADFINNTAYHNSQTDHTLPTAHNNDGEIYVNNSGDVLIQNNVLVADAGKRVNTNSRHTNVTHTNNLYFGGTTIAVLGSSPVQADPQFVYATTDWATANFRLAPGSPAINAGVNNLLSATDLAGNPRLLGATVDLGAYESAAPLAAPAARPPAPLLRAYPNPAAGPVMLAYVLDRPGPVRLEVLDLLGRRVALLVDAPRPAGPHEAHFDVSAQSAGLYHVRLTTAQGRTSLGLTRQP